MSAEMVSATSRGRYGWPIAAFAAVLVAWAGLGWFASTQSDPGRFGDMFGAVNALFTGLAFAGLIYTIFLQREELALQRQELALTRDELAGQRAAMEAQNKVLAAQDFKSTFFQLLRLHNDIVSAMDLVGESNTTRGRDCFVVFQKRLRTRLNQELAVDPGARLAEIHAAYADFYARDQANLGHYFRSLYNLVKLVDAEDVHNKRVFTNLVRAQLSDAEVSVLFYNCLSTQGARFKPLAQKYALLKHLDPRSLAQKTDLLLVDAEAFGTNSQSAEAHRKVMFS